MKVLIVDDHELVRRGLALIVKDTFEDAEVEECGNAADALEVLHKGPVDAALLDVRMPEVDGIELLKEIKARQPACEVIIMTGYSTIKTAVTAVQLGAYEYLEKPFDDIGEIEALIEKAATHGINLLQGNQAREEWDEIAQAVGFQVGTSPSMKRLVSLAYKIANKNINILIQGKTGTGKEVLSRFIHAASNRADQAFIPINCGALPENLLESELFGHEKGAYTGANQTRRGIFELANRGTLLLDEIGDASPQIQVKLLRVLETGEFMRVGGEKPIKTDVRVIAATNVDLEEAIREKTFREDLYYRLNVVRLEIPPLRARAGDVPLLAEHFVRLLNPDMRISPAAMRLLQDYSWPGNIRELANVLRRAMVLCNGDLILPNHLGSTFQSGPADPGRTTPPPVRNRQAPDSPISVESFWEHYATPEVLERMGDEELQRMLHDLQGLETRLHAVMHQKGLAPNPRRGLKDTEEETIKKALEQYRWNITEAAKVLGIARNTLYRKIKQFKLMEP